MSGSSGNYCALRIAAHPVGRNTGGRTRNACASVADLVKVDGVSQALAERIYAFFHPQAR